MDNYFYTILLSSHLRQLGTSAFGTPRSNASKGLVSKALYMLKDSKKNRLWYTLYAVSAIAYPEVDYRHHSLMQSRAARY